jgi:hypothetical protein
MTPIHFLRYASRAAVLLPGLILLVGCGAGTVETGKTIKSGSAGNGLTVRLTSRDGVLRDGDNRLLLVFEDSSGKAVEVERASLNFNMPAMGTMPEMNDAALLTTTTQPGIYDARVKLQMAGEWIAQIAYEGNAGKGKTVLTVSAQ